MSQADVSTCSAPQRVFQEAVKKGNTKELHSLLQNMTNCEFNVNSFGPEGQTALHQSVIDGNLELVKLLVKFGADIRLANREGWSALHIAAFGATKTLCYTSSPRPSTPLAPGDLSLLSGKHKKKDLKNNNSNTLQSLHRLKHKCSEISRESVMLLLLPDDNEQ
ncbi:hypothetical protein INR49_015152 [Caranx melampygus]|nr:hypothetical protein INR49_015152 [Caranx melampygus]